MLPQTNYPVFTVIMRGYSLAEADAITSAMSDFSEYFAVEVTLNTPNALEIIQHLSATYGSRVKIGAGTVRTLTDAQQAVAAGAEFLLGPHMFSKEILEFCRGQQIISVPSAMTPSEINEMVTAGASMVKIFPAAVVGSRFFKDVQAPLGKLPLMAVGGISEKNIAEFLTEGASFVGIGSGMFSKESIKHLDRSSLIYLHISQGR